MQKDLDNQDEDLIEAVQKIKVEVELGRQEDELFHRNRQQRNAELLAQMDDFDKLIAVKKKVRCQKISKEMQRLEQESLSLVTKMINAFDKTHPEKLTNEPSPRPSDEFTKK